MYELGIIVVVAGVALLVLISILSRPPKLNKEYYRGRWQKIEVLITGNNQNEWYRAVIDADKLLDHALKAANFNGKTMGDRLKSAHQLKHINAAWNAHKLRNKLVHDSDVKLKKNYAVAAVNSFKVILKDIGAL